MTFDSISHASVPVEAKLELAEPKPEHPLRLEKLRLNDGKTLAVAQRIIANTQQRLKCLEWQKAKDRDGYGVTYYRQSQWRVHRFVFLAWISEIPDGQFVLHSCDNPSCCFPDHLFLGDAGTNARDCRDKGRLGIAIGERTWNARLSEEQVKYILDNYCWRTSGRTAPALAKRLNVTVGAVWGVIYGRTWKHIHIPKTKDNP